MKRQAVTLTQGLFDEKGMFLAEEKPLIASSEASDLYVDRYLDFFPDNCLNGKKIGVYQHSAVGRDDMVAILSGLGAHVTPLGYSESFIPVDTEAIRPLALMLPWL